MHATFINQPAYVALALEPAVRADRQSAQTELGATVLRAWRLLKERERDRVNAVARRRREAAEPNYDDIAVLSSAIRAADSLVFDQLRAHALDTYAIAARLLARSCEPPDELPRSCQRRFGRRTPRWIRLKQLRDEPGCGRRQFGSVSASERRYRLVSRRRRADHQEQRHRTEAEDVHGVIDRRRRRRHRSRERRNAARGSSRRH